MEILLKNGQLFTMRPEEKPWIGDVLIKNGRIAKVKNNLNAPSAKVVDCSGLAVLPGLIDSHCHIGLFGTAMGERGVDGNETSHACTPELQAIDSINPYDEEFAYARTHGITTVSTGPGSANPIAGQFVTLKTSDKPLMERVLLAPSAIKMAFGENPKTAHNGKAPLTRMATAAIVREALLRAKRYGQDQDTAQEKNTSPPPFDIKMEALLPVLRGNLPVKAHAHRADDILTALRIAEEFNLDMSIEHCSEGHLIPDQLSSANGVIIGPLLGFPHKLEVKNQSPATAKVFEDQGVLFAIMSDLPASHVDGIILAAGACIREGLSEDMALRAITINAAKILKIDQRVGSIEPGKDADIAIFTSNPLKAVNARCIMTLIDGQIVHEQKSV